MNKAVLIHHDNVPENVKKLFHIENILRFDYSAEKHNDLDAYISNEIIDALKNKNVDIIFIKDNLSINYLELYGLRTAYHIRLSDILKDIRYIPIVILSDIDGFTLNRIEPIAEILFTKNIFLVSNTEKAIINYINQIPLRLSENEYKSMFLNRIAIDLSEDTTSHSITNEWGIYQWSYILDISSEAIDKNKKKISTMLYFKYVIAKYHLETKSKNPIKQIKKSGKILLVDDKWDTGWKDIVDSFIKQQYSDVNLEVLACNFKDKSIEELKAILREKTKDNLPDIILLDLRLKESDNIISTKKKSINKLSGIQLIGEIKKINPGIQIIMFTASGDSLILDEFYNKGVLGYIKKDAPSEKYEASKNSFKKLNTLIKRGMDRCYLKEAWDTQENLLKTPFLLHKNDPTIYELRKNIESFFDILNSNIPNAFIYTMLSIFKNFEIITSLYIEEKFLNGNKVAVWVDDNMQIDTLDNDKLRATNKEDYNLSIENKIRVIIAEKTTLEDESINPKIKQLVCSRNYAIHPIEKERCEKYLVKEPRAEHIIEWLRILNKILEELVI